MLSLLSANSKVLADPAVLLARALDPPAPETVQQALQYLQQVSSHISGSLNPGRHYHVMAMSGQLSERERALIAVDSPASAPHWPTDTCGGFVGVSLTWLA